MSTRSLRSSVTGQTLRRDGPHHPDVPGIVGNCDTADGGALCVGINSNEAWLEFYEFDSIPEIGADPRWDSYDTPPGPLMGPESPSSQTAMAIWRSTPCGPMGQTCAD